MFRPGSSVAPGVLKLAQDHFPGIFLLFLNSLSAWFLSTASLSALAAVVAVFQLVLAVVSLVSAWEREG